MGEIVTVAVGGLIVQAVLGAVVLLMVVGQFGFVRPSAMTIPAPISATPAMPK